MKYLKWKNLSKKGKAVIGAGAFIIVGSIVGTVTSCNAKEESQTDTLPATNTAIEQTDNTVVETPVVDDTYSKYYQEIDTVEDEVVDFVNEGLANGLFDFGPEGPTEEDKEFMATTYLNYYLALNNQDLSGNTLDILNQESDLTSYELLEDTFKAESGLQGQSIISTTDTKMDFDAFIVQEDDREFVQNLVDKIALMAEATRNGDKEALDAAAEEVIAIKESLLDPTVSDKLEYSTRSLVLMYIDAADALYNGQIITTEEDKIELYNASIRDCEDILLSLTDEQIKSLAIELNIEGYETMTTDEIIDYLSDANKVSMGTDLRSASRVMLRHVLEEQLAYSNIDLSIVDSYYSYDELEKRIEDQIDLSLYNEPASVIETLNQNPYGPNYYKEDGTMLVGTTTTVEVPPEVVPEGEIVPPESKSVAYEEDENGEITEVETNDTYLQAKTAGLTDGNNAAVAVYPSQYSNPNDMPVSPKGNVEKPSTDSKDYDKIYNYFYNQAWNEFRSSAVAAYNTAIQENETAPVIEEYTTNVEGQEELVEEGTPILTPATPSDEPEVIFTPVEGEEELVEEGDIQKELAYLRTIKEVIVNEYMYSETKNIIKK